VHYIIDRHGEGLGEGLLGKGRLLCACCREPKVSLNNILDNQIVDFKLQVPFLPLNSVPWDQKNRTRELQRLLTRALLSSTRNGDDDPGRALEEEDFRGERFKDWAQD